MRRGPDRRFLVTLASISLIGPLAIHMFLPAMPVIKSVFAASDALVGLTYSVALLVMAFATLVYGSLSDRYGRRPMLLTGLFLFTFGQRRVGHGGFRLRPHGRTGHPGPRGRLRRHPCPRHRAGRLRNGGAGQGDRLSDDGIHAWTHDWGALRRGVDRHGRLAQHVLVCRDRRRAHCDGVLLGAVRNAPEGGYPARNLQATSESTPRCFRTRASPPSYCRRDLPRASSTPWRRPRRS